MVLGAGSRGHGFSSLCRERVSQTYYEGFAEVGATPYGIANTNEFSIKAFSGVIPSDEELRAFGERIQKPAVYVGTPEYYHELHAFGFWSLVKRESQMENWLEDQLERAVEFYRMKWKSAVGTDFSITEILCIPMTGPDIAGDMTWEDTLGRIRSWCPRFGSG